MILDTNALSAFVDGNVAIEPLVTEARIIAVPVIALGEFRFGLAHSRRRMDYERWLDEELPRFLVLTIDATTSEPYATIRLELKTAGTPIPVNDLWIASLARQHQMPVLGRDQHFDSVRGLRRFGW